MMESWIYRGCSLLESKGTYLFCLDSFFKDTVVFYIKKVQAAFVVFKFQALVSFKGWNGKNFKNITGKDINR